MTTRSAPSAAGWAALLSFIAPGLGQLYNGKFLRALFWFVITPGFWIGSGGLLGWVCHVAAAYTAHRWAVANPAEAGGLLRS